MPVDPNIVDTIATSTAVNSTDVAATLSLALEIARNGGEEHRIGALFTLGNAERVLARSRPLILDPLRGHAQEATHISDPRVRGTVKELAKLDGAFVVADSGTVVAACRYLDSSAEGVHVPFGLGSRHLAAAAISKEPGVAAIVVSQGGGVRVFCNGDLAVQL